MKNSFQKAFTRAAFAGLLLTAGATAASAQTSGTLTGTATTYNYSTAPWVITSGTGATYPTGGGVATFNPSTTITPGTLGAADTVTLDVSPTLSGITYNDPFTTAIAAGTGQSLIAATTGLTLNAFLTATNSPTAIFTTFNTISAPITGGGAAGLTKTGSGTVTLTGTNTFTGGVHVNGGLLVVAGAAAVGDNVFGAAGSDISFDGGTLFTNTTGGLVTARNIVLGAGGGTIQNSTAFTVNGVISGAGSLSVNGFGATQLTLTAANVYTGATITSLSTVSYLTLSGNGSIATSASYDLSGQLNLDNSGTTGINRISDTAAIAARGVYVNLTGNATTATAETVGAITLADGVSTINVTPGTAGATLTTAGVTRQNGGLLFVRGTNLGAGPGAGNSTILATAAPTLVGGAGATGSTTISIAPSVIGNLTASTTSANSLANSIGSTFVTYDPTNGLRPLATTEYATALGGNATDNVRFTATTTAPAGATANSLLFAPAVAGTVLSGGPINVTSGAVMYSPTATTLSGTTVVGLAGTISAGLNFGAAEGVITATAPLTVSGALTGTGGLTVASPTGSTITVSGANTYTGATNIIASQILYSGAVANDGATAGPFGLGTTPIVLNAGLGFAFLNATGTTTFDRNLLVAGAAAPGLDYFGSTSGAGTVTMNGNIELQHGLTIVGGNSTTPVIFNGTISGVGGLTGFGAGYFNTINGNNTFTGGVNAQGDTFTLGSDTAFGNGGTVYTSAASTFQGSGTAARTIANPWVYLATPTFTGTAPLTLSGTMNLNGARTLAISNTALTTISGVVSNGSLTKTLTGAVAFNSPTGNTFTGGFTNTGAAANSSAIYVNNTTGSGLGTGAVNIGAASAAVYSTLAGNFTIAGNTTIAGRLSPGNGAGLTAATAGQGSIGLARFGGNLTLGTATTSSLFVDIATANAGGFDKLEVTGTLTLNSTVFLATTGSGLQVGNVLDLADWGILAATSAVTFNTTNVAQGVTFDTTNFLTNGTITVTAVPEPGTYAMLGFGGLLTAVVSFLRRRVRGQAC